MLKKTKKLPLRRLSEGQATLGLLAENQQLRAIIARRKGNTATAEIHEAAAQHFNAIYHRNDFHTAPQNALLSFNPNAGTTAVNNLVLQAMGLSLIHI